MRLAAAPRRWSPSEGRVRQCARRPPFGSPIRALTSLQSICSSNLWNGRARTPPRGTHAIGRSERLQAAERAAAPSSICPTVLSSRHSVCGNSKEGRNDRVRVSDLKSFDKLCAGAQMAPHSRRQVKNSNLRWRPSMRLTWCDFVKGNRNFF